MLPRIHSLRAGGLTTRRIAAALNAEWARTRRGTAWRFEYVAAALRAGRQFTIAA